MQSFLSPDWSNRGYINANYTIWQLCNISLLWLKELNPKTSHWQQKSGSHCILPVQGPAEDNLGAEPPLPNLLTLLTSSPSCRPALVSHGFLCVLFLLYPLPTIWRISFHSHLPCLLSSLSLALTALIVPNHFPLATVLKQCHGSWYGPSGRLWHIHHTWRAWWMRGGRTCWTKRSKTASNHMARWP